MKTYITFAQDKKTDKFWEFQHKSINGIEARKEGRSIVKSEKNLKYLTTKILK